MTNNHEDQHDSRHPSFMQYVVIAIILFAVTIVEFLLIWDKVGVADDLGASKIPILVILSAFKFAVVIMFYMHLKFDAKLFSLMFVSGLVLAFIIGIAVIGTFFGFEGEPRDYALANAVPYVHGEEGAGEHEGDATPSETEGDATPSETEGDPPPSETQGDPPPSETQGDAISSETEGAATSSETEGAATSSETEGAATSSETEGAATSSETEGAAVPSGGDPAGGTAVFTNSGCFACHTIEGVPGAVGQLGPELTHVATTGATRKGLSAEEYIRESIENPSAFVVDGFAPIMPSLRGAMGDAEFEDLVAFLLTQN